MRRQSSRWLGSAERPLATIHSLHILWTAQPHDGAQNDAQDDEPITKREPKFAVTDAEADQLQILRSFAGAPEQK